jgi:NAD(P)-dependent dehydrogenase (short-subunit alcohol dehydrogenase family)
MATDGHDRASTDLAGRVAVVTGGGRDLGRAIALHLAAHGADVAVLGRTPVTLEATAAAIEATGRRAWALTCDVTDEDQVVGAFATLADQAGRLDVLVNNAAAARLQRPVAEMPVAEWQEAFAIKVTGAMLCSREALRSMVPAGRGAIVNISGTTGVDGLANVSAHSVAQAGLIALTQSLAKEVGRQGVRVNAVVPSAIEGEHLQRITATHDDLGQAPGGALLARLVEGSPLGRLVQPGEVAAAVAFLASDASSGMTGRTLELLL